MPHRHRHFSVALLSLVLTGAACAGSHPTTAPTTSPSPSLTPSSAAPPSLPAPPGASPSLPPVRATPAPPTGSATIALPGPVPNPATPLVAAEAPDGTVFLADPSVSPEVVWVVNGNGPAALAEHPAGKVAALAADATSLYVATAQAITSYDRSTGNQARSWPVQVNPAAESAGSTLAVAGGRLWLLGGTAGHPSIDSIDPAGAAVQVVVANASNVTGLAAGPDAVYYVGDSGATLIRLGGDGTRTSAPTNITVNAQLSGPAAVQAMSVSDGRVLVMHAAGQGLDAEVASYDAATLHGPAGRGTTTLTNLPVVPTQGGPRAVVNSAGGATASCPTPAGQQPPGWCVAQVSVPAAGSPGSPVAPLSFSQLLPLPSQPVSPLVGPYPALAVVAGGHQQLWRLAY